MNQQFSMLSEDGYRLFVAGVKSTPDLTTKLVKVFSKYGEVSSVQHFAKRGFAFVTMTTVDQAQCALAELSDVSSRDDCIGLFTAVKAAVAAPRRHPENSTTAAESPSYVGTLLLAPASHVDRVKQYISSREWCTDSGFPQILTVTQP